VRRGVVLGSNFGRDLLEPPQFRRKGIGCRVLVWLRPMVGKVTVCGSCVGSGALLADLEELCRHVEVLGAPCLGGCLNACSEGPNCLVNGEVLHRNRTFTDSIEVLRRCQGSDLGKEFSLPDESLRKAQLKSDALRRMQCGPTQNMTEAVALLSEAISLERGSEGASRRLSELLALRATARASPDLADFAGAIGDYEEIVASRPASARVYFEKAKVLRRARRPADASQCLKKAIELADERGQDDGEAALSASELAWIRSSIENLADLVALGEVGSPDTFATDSGDGSGRWKVVKITGMSFDTCIYHLENQPPAAPHPYPSDAWHVSVCLGTASRDYTPISSAEDWEKGKLDLLVKTYANGIVTRKFAALQPFNVSQGACWVTVTVPKLTLRLPALVDGLSVQRSLEAPEIVRIGLVVGGTGIVPALQILSNVALGAGGAFSADCRASLLYASRRASDVLALDELRQAEVAAEGRIAVWHTLTDHKEEGAAREVEEAEASAAFSKGLSDLPCRHRFFASLWKPRAAKFGPLRTGVGEEAGLRGRPDARLLEAVLPAPGRDARIVVCGPPGMWEDVRDLLLGLGHDASSLVELHALSAEQVQGGPSTRLHRESGPPVAQASDQAARLEAARAIAASEDALRLKAAAASVDGTGAAAAPKTGADVAKRKWGDAKWQGSGPSASWWSDSGWSDGGWKSSKWR